MSDDLAGTMREYADEPWKYDGGSWPDKMMAGATEIDRLRAELAKFDGMLPVPAEDANDLDDVVRELGIEDSFTTPAEAVRELKAEIDRLRAELASKSAAFELATIHAKELEAELASRQIDVEIFREGNRRIRAELADALQCASVEAGLRREARAELAAKDARIAALEAAGNRLGDAAVDGVLTSIEAVTEQAERDEAITRAERAEARIAELETHLQRIVNDYGICNARAERAEAHINDVLLASENGCLRAELSQTKRDLKDWQDSSEAYRHDAEKAEADCAEAKAMLGIAKAHVAALCDLAVYSDSYGVPGSDFACCHFCRAGGAPNVVFKHDDSCPVGRAEATAQEWWDERREAEADCKRAEAVLHLYAEAQRWATGTEEHRLALQKADTYRAGEKS